METYRIKAPDKLRLAMLYALRYEDMGNIRMVKSRLLDAGLTPEKVDLVDALLQYAGGSSSVSKDALSPLRPLVGDEKTLLNNISKNIWAFIPLYDSGNASRGPGLFGQEDMMSKLGKQITTTLQV